MVEQKTGRYIVHLIYSVLNGTQPSEKPDDITYEDIYKMSVMHNVCVMTLTAIDKLNNKPDENLYKQWDRKRNAAAAQGIVQLRERDIILDALEKRQIRSIPLKGCLLKEMYPRQEYREMSDLDILIDEENRAEVRDIMESLGYDADEYGISKDDSYRKPPFMHVEIHNRLLEDKTIDRLNIQSDALIHPFDYSERQKDSYHYSMSWENFYLYFTAHNAKHYLFSGCGIRQFVDLGILHENCEIDMDYVQEVLGNGILEEFMRNSERLVDCWKNEKEVPDDLKEMELIAFAAGSYGNSESRIMNNMRRAEQAGSQTEGGYLTYRLFPPYHLMRAVYPSLKKAPFLLPVYWVHRLLSKGMPDMKKYYEELKTFRHFRSDKNSSE